MDKAKPFDDYFNDSALSPEKLERMRLTRTLVHKLCPDAQERVSYAMPGFYPKGTTTPGFNPKGIPKANQPYFLLMACHGWLGIYGVQGLSDETLAPFEKLGVTSAKGSLKVPYDMPEPEFTKLLQTVITHNTTRRGFLT